MSNSGKMSNIAIVCDTTRTEIFVVQVFTLAISPAWMCMRFINLMIEKETVLLCHFNDGLYIVINSLPKYFLVMIDHYSA